MDKASSASVNGRRLVMAAVVVAAILAALPASAAQRRPPQPHGYLRPDMKAAGGAGADEAMKDCFITDKNGRKWPCSRRLMPTAANLTMFACAIENRMGEEMYFDCDDDPTPFFVDPGDTVPRSYESFFDPAPKHGNTRPRTGPRVTCLWSCAGNDMRGVVVWDEQWPEEWSCREEGPVGGGGGGKCKLVFENREVALVTAGGGRRVLGDLAVKECSKNWWGYGRWLPWGLGCTYPKHDHPYVGTID